MPTESKLFPPPHIHFVSVFCHCGDVLYVALRYFLDCLLSYTPPHICNQVRCPQWPMVRYGARGTLYSGTLTVEYTDLIDANPYGF